MSIRFLVFVVLGGIGSMRGSIIAAIVLTLLPELLRDFSQYRMFIYSIVLIVIMLFNQAPVFVQLRQRLAAKLRGNRQMPEETVETADAGYFEAKKSGKEEE